MGVYYAQIDCDLPRDTRMIAAGPLGRMLYIQCILYARENLTDGVIDALWLPLIAMDIARPRHHLARLVEVGALEQTTTGWRIPIEVWRRHNPMKSEVDAKRQAEADRKARYREKSQRDKAGTDAPVPTGQPVTETSTRRSVPDRKRQETETETETETEVLTSQHNSSTARTTSAGMMNGTSTKNGTTQPRVLALQLAKGGEALAERLLSIGEAAAKHLWENANQSAIANQAAFRNAEIVKALKHDDIVRYAREYPEGRPDQVAAWMRGEKHSMQFVDKVEVGPL